ncbi:hypothetical protein PUW25_02735 [Paenibacillus urinalis]|uniref:Uncharacterized protein n=1 Tax=Paenibacillus urinalis TaxID=521520 RepID=A0ABY7XH25_9BACL|nr:hypothetical protein [Paenibacillus urinalis]WDI02925.1 hypothetical protein PUW25_02735 [Paenibacillus urinalis]
MIDNVKNHCSQADSTLGTETNTTAQAPSKSEKNWMYYFHEILKGIAVFK